MIKEETSKLPKINIEGIKSVMREMDNIGKSIATPNVNTDMFIKPETKMMSELVKDTKEIKKSTKISFWGSLLTNLLCAIAGGVVTLLIEHLLF